MARFLSFSSGSCGNCYFITGDNPSVPGILVDSGVSIRQVKNNLMSHGFGLNDISDILVTHDHLDHIRNLGSFCKKMKIPVHATDVLHGALSHHTFTYIHISNCRRILQKDEWNTVGAASVKYFEVPHDATQTVGYAIKIDGNMIVIMTDIGRMTDEAIEFASGADTVIIESNYDTDMLFSGNYPADLKMRISQGFGHLSNDECADAIRRFAHDGLGNIFLCHLSENNNTPSLAYESAKRAIADSGFDINLEVLPRSRASRMFNL